MRWRCERCRKIIRNRARTESRRIPLSSDGLAEAGSRPGSAGVPPATAAPSRKFLADFQYDDRKIVQDFVTRTLALVERAAARRFLAVAGWERWDFIAVFDLVSVHGESACPVVARQIHRRGIIIKEVMALYWQPHRHVARKATVGQV